MRKQRARQSRRTATSGVWLRVVAGLAVGAVVGAGGLWIAIHRVPSLGPALADAARSVVGPRAIAWAEDVAYGLQDRVDAWRYRDAPPKAYWDAPGAPPPAPTEAAPSGQAEPTDVLREQDAITFVPPPFAPPFPKVALPGDGTWVPVPLEGDGAPIFHKALVHPDPHRNYAVVAVVSIDLAHVALHEVVGTAEPASDAVPRSRRSGLVPSADAEALVAAFNGGWQAIHGHWGMKAEGNVVLPPKPAACTVAIYRDGRVRIRSWPVVAPDDDELVAWRQTPPCLVEQGVHHAGLGAEHTRNWGATVDGETVIRRSALGIDAAGRTLFYGMGDGLTAPSIARAMAAAGAFDVAQLDVNFAFPRFLFYGKRGGEKVAVEALVPSTTWKPGEYVRQVEYRDFFYLTRRAEPAVLGGPR